MQKNLVKTKLGKSMADMIVSTAKRRNRLRIRGRGVTKPTTTKAEKRNQSSCLIDRLPRDVLMGILSTLRVKSLLQLTCVCKSWYSLISDSQFVKTHLNRSIACPDLLKQRQHIFMMTNLILSKCPYAFTLESALPDDNVGDIVPSVVKLDYIPEIKKYAFRSYITVIGSCDGLLCLRFGSTAFYVFNLSTRESKRIPEPYFKFCYWEDFYILGFGYDQSVHDYKLVAGDKKRFYVYSLRTDSWKKVQDLPYNHLPEPFSSGVLLNGAIHWLFSWKRRSKIVAFCFADEKFWEFPVPTLSFNLGLLGGCLCILRGNEFWVMEEYGMVQSWTKVVIEIPSITIRALALLENTEAILKIDSKKLVLYNTRERTYRDLLLPDFLDVEKIGAYVESLVSPCHGNLS